MSTSRFHNRLLAKQMRDPEFAAAYEEARKQIEQSHGPNSWPDELEEQWANYEPPKADLPDLSGQLGKTVIGHSWENHPCTGVAPGAIEEALAATLDDKTHRMTPEEGLSAHAKQIAQEFGMTDSRVGVLQEEPVCLDLESYDLWPTPGEVAKAEDAGALWESDYEPFSRGMSPLVRRLQKPCPYPLYDYTSLRLPPPIEPCRITPALLRRHLTNFQGISGDKNLLVTRLMDALRGEIGKPLLDTTHIRDILEQTVSVLDG